MRDFEDRLGIEQRLTRVEEQVKNLRWIAYVVAAGLLSNLALSAWAVRLLAER